MVSASMIAKRIESRGAPTKDTMAIKFAPMAIEIAVRAVPTERPKMKMATKGIAVMAPATGVSRETSTFSVLRSAERVSITEVARRGAGGERSSQTSVRGTLTDATLPNVQSGVDLTHGFIVREAKRTSLIGHGRLQRRRQLIAGWSLRAPAARWSDAGSRRRRTANRDLERPMQMGVVEGVVRL